MVLVRSCMVLALTFLPGNYVHFWGLMGLGRLRLSRAYVGFYLLVRGGFVLRGRTAQDLVKKNAPTTFPISRKGIAN